MLPIVCTVSSSQSRAIDRTCMINICGSALHLDMTALARVGHKPQPQGRECAGSLARHERKRASVNGHDVAAGSLSWAVTGEPRGRCQCHGLEYTNRTGAEDLQVLTGDWIEDRALCTNLKSISMDFGNSEY